MRIPSDLPNKVLPTACARGRVRIGHGGGAVRAAAAGDRRRLEIPGRSWRWPVVAVLDLSALGAGAPAGAGRARGRGGSPARRALPARSWAWRMVFGLPGRQHRAVGLLERIGTGLKIVAGDGAGVRGAPLLGGAAAFSSLGSASVVVIGPYWAVLAGIALGLRAAGVGAVLLAFALGALDLGVRLHLRLRHQAAAIAQRPGGAPSCWCRRCLRSAP